MNLTNYLVVQVILIWQVGTATSTFMREACNALLLFPRCAGSDPAQAAVGSSGDVNLDEFDQLFGEVTITGPSQFSDLRYQVDCEPLSCR